VKPYLLSSQAERDLDEIKAYLLRESSQQVTRYIFRELREGMRFLGKNPYAGHLREDLTERAVRFWAVFSYFIVYDPEKRPVEIARILHGALDIPNIL
jgi:toxin ParE1/3/4